jgi:hypothetical protein
MSEYYIVIDDCLSLEYFELFYSYHKKNSKRFTSIQECKKYINNHIMKDNLVCVLFIDDINLFWEEYSKACNLKEIIG